MHQLVSFMSFQSIEGEAIELIDQSLKMLRSSAVAFDMLMKFKKICSRDVINNHLKTKFNDVLTLYYKEVLYHKPK